MYSAVCMIFIRVKILLKDVGMIVPVYVQKDRDLQLCAWSNLEHFSSSCHSCLSKL